MKLKAIEFYNHPILGTTQFDFTDERGNAVDTIILAGDNGSGKTTLLEAIFYFSNCSFRNVHYGDISLEDKTSCIYHAALPEKTTQSLKTFETQGILPGSIASTPLENITGNIKFGIDLAEKNTIKKILCETKDNGKRDWLDIKDIKGEIVRFMSEHFSTDDAFRCLYSIADSYHNRIKRVT